MDEDGWTTIPVAAAFTGVRFLPWWLGIATNNARPLLAIGPNAVRYRVIVKQERPFSDIETIDVRTAWKTANLCLFFRGSAFTFMANLRTVDACAQALALFPPDLALTERAREVRAGGRHPARTTG